jgi:predicted house-cleaning NTP pyrophosphatase (Maf/HAM1 superfamily)
MPARRLVLASTSRYRSELLQRLRLSFTVRAPGVDETALPGEAPQALALRLALAKADAIADLDRDAVVIGSDQVADSTAPRSASPATTPRAVAQLRSMRGRTVVFHTAVAVACVETGFRAAEVAPVTVRFRDLERRRDRALPAHRAAVRLRRQRQGRDARHRPARGDRVRRPDGADRPAADPHLGAAAPGRDRSAAFRTPGAGAATR